MSEKFNPWTVVNVVFAHLAENGLHPVLGEAGDPSEPAAALLRCLGVTPGQPAQRDEQVRADLAALRERFEETHGTPGPSGTGPGEPADAPAPGAVGGPR